MRWLTITGMLVASAPFIADAQELSAQQTEARAHFQLGRVHLEQGRFVEAAREFEEAHRLSPAPELLYDIFVANRDAGRIEEAAAALRSYLEVLPADNPTRPTLEARLRSLDQQIAERRELEQRHREPPPATPPQSASPVPWIVVGVGAAVVVAAAITGGLALDLQGRLESQCSGGVCPASLQSDLDTGRALALSTDVLWPVGLAVIAAGAIWGIVELTSTSSSARAAIACVPDGCAAAVAGSF